jgi:hypothetical protein
MTELLENLARAILVEQDRAEHALCGQVQGVNRQVDRLAIAQEFAVQEAQLALATMAQPA